MVETLSVQKQALEKRTSDLEGTVTEKTQELQSKISELEKVNELMIGRELKMIELKKEIEALRAKIGGV